MNEWIDNVTDYWNSLHGWQAVLASIVVLAVVGLLALSLARVARVLLTRWLRRRDRNLGNAPAAQADHLAVLLPTLRPLRLLLPLLAMLAVTPALPLNHDAMEVLAAIFRVAMIGAVAWLIIGLMGSGQLLATRLYSDTGPNDLHARSLRTRLNVLIRIASFIVALIAIGIALMTFEAVRAIGVTLFSAAGVAGIVLGLAAQKSLGSVLAGIQIALAQPIRLGDVVVVENEFGTIEEITLTYVVVSIWDQRRMVLPITYFVDKHFVNYTRTSSQIIGSIFWHVDYRTPVPRVREKFLELVRKNEIWDGRAAVLQVTDILGDTMQLRGLVSTRNASDAWNLRCEIREQLMHYLQTELPEALPLRRAEIQSFPQNGRERQPEPKPPRTPQNLTEA